VVEAASPAPTPTKLCVIVVSNADADPLMHALVQQDIQATKVSSSGGFLRRGNATVFTGVPADRVDEVVEIVRRECHARRELVPIEALPFDPTGGLGIEPLEVRAGGATVFVVDISRYERV
jgi:uncharacterized protein YaaQ